MSFDFDEQLTIGRRGEQIWAAYLKDKGFHVTRSTYDDRVLGIDLRASKSGTPVETFQVKYETRANGRVALEVWSQWENRRFGGHLTTRAKYVVHVDSAGKCYVFDAQALKLNIAATFRDQRLIDVKNAGYTTKVIIIEIADLNAAGALLFTRNASMFLGEDE